ncbi:hypothetical protein K7J14_07015 [Treponema zuelzerae]|uniref:Uncharacterized protein n=1 Tax=Teretinema zuelzerae TaxID=156 RepID=A0AAE3EJ61_9SPIR|nr:hypothetical protein [Teretinema zuelzerae]MCD1654454.1 hypothetical protein [Teretinema zuelzerae]
MNNRILSVEILNAPHFYTLYADGHEDTMIEKPNGVELLYPPHAVLFLYYTFPAHRRVYCVRNSETGKSSLPGLSMPVSILFKQYASRVDKTKRAVSYLRNTILIIHIHYLIRFIHDLEYTCSQKASYRMKRLIHYFKGVFLMDVLLTPDVISRLDIASVSIHSTNTIQPSVVFAFSKSHISFISKEKPDQFIDPTFVKITTRLDSFSLPVSYETTMQTKTRHWIFTFSYSPDTIEPPLHDTWMTLLDITHVQRLRADVRVSASKKNIDALRMNPMATEVFFMKQNWIVLYRIFLFQEHDCYALKTT